MEERARRPRLLAWLVAVALVAGIAGGVAGAAITHFLSDEPAPVQQTNTTVEQRQVTMQEDSATAETVKNAVPSVVTIVNQLASTNSFGAQTQETASGSGVIVDGRGYIVTNQHVVKGAATITVILNDGREMPATVVSSDDPFTDLAVLKVDAGDETLPALSWGNSDNLELGQRVVAIGSALNEFRDSVTAGVVSGIHRNWEREGVLMEDLIQTDAAVNHGNSGGALLNTEGELVGLNTSVIRSTDSGEPVEGMAFAISSNTAAPIVQGIIDQGSYPRAYLGMSHQDIVGEMTEVGGSVIDHGAVVGRVSAGSPAADAGIQEGDIILQMGDIVLSKDMPFLNALGRLQPGQAVTVLIDRDGKQMSIVVTPVARDRTTG